MAGQRWIEQQSGSVIVVSNGTPLHVLLDSHLCVELKLDQVARLGLDVVGREDQGAVRSADLDDVCVDHSRRSR